jgi:hypothetical protein
MCGCKSSVPSTKAGAPSGEVFPGSGEVAIWMHKPGMTSAQRIIALGAVSGRTIFFVQDRTLPVDVRDVNSLRAAVEAAGGSLHAQPDWMYYSSPANISSYTAPSGVVYSFGAGFRRPVLVSDVSAIQLAHGVTLTN